MEPDPSAWGLAWTAETQNDKAASAARAWRIMEPLPFDGRRLPAAAVAVYAGRGASSPTARSAARISSTTIRSRSPIEDS
jgi:hypothetical protein